MPSPSCWSSTHLSASRPHTKVVPMKLHIFWDMVHSLQKEPCIDSISGSTHSHSHRQRFVNFTHPQSKRSHTSGVDACSSWPLSWSDISCQVAVSPKHRGRISQEKNLSLGDSWPTQQMHAPLEEKRLLTDITINAEMQEHHAEFI